VTPSEIRLTSAAAAATPPSVPAITPMFPSGAVLSVAFNTAPRVVADLNRLFGAKVSDLFADGGELCIYDVDVRKFLPRPLGVIVVPDTPQRTAEVEALHDIVHTAKKGVMLMLSFDRDIDRYASDTFAVPQQIGNQWTLRIDAPRLVPILNGLDKNLGLRIVAPRLYRSARDLEGWLGGLEQAKVIDASDSVGASGETLQVRIAAK
jgi:hypothetical protein